MKVLKFGGSSVGNAENIEKVVEIVRDASEKSACAVVLSAMQGTTDALIEIGRTAERGEEPFREKIKEVENKHLETIHALISSGENDSTLNFLKNQISEL